MLLALSKLDAVTDVLASLENGNTPELAEGSVSTLPFIARDLMHEVMYDPAKR